MKLSSSLWEARSDSSGILKAIIAACLLNARAGLGARFLAVLFSALFFLTASLFGAEFPPILVISGTAYPGVEVTGSSETYSKYVVPGDGVLILHETNGFVSWGATESTALDSPEQTGWWDGVVVSFESRTVAVPQVLVSFPAALPPEQVPVMLGYDGAQRSPLGTGTTAEGRFVVAYNGFSDGYIFKFGESLPCYRYQAGPDPITINTGPGWPTGTLSVFPAEIIFNGHTYDVASSTEGFANGYWSQVCYTGSNGGGDMHVYIAADGSIGEMWGTVWEGSGEQSIVRTVNADWNPTTQRFTASQTLGGVQLSVSGTASYGPPAVELNGQFLAFRYRDTQGAELYTDPTGATWVAVNSPGIWTASSAYSTASGQYDKDNQIFRDGGDLAAVSADGTKFLDPGIGLVVCTKGVNPGACDVYDNSESPTATFSSDYSLYRADGTSIFAYKSAGSSPGRYVGFQGSPLYTGTNSIDASAGWPPGVNLFVQQQLPPTLIINGERFDSGGPNLNGSPGRVVANYDFYGDNGGFFSVEIGASIVYGNWVSWGGSIGSGNSIPSDWVALGDIGAPSFGPPRISWNGNSCFFRWGDGGADYYKDSSGNRINIESSGAVSLFAPGNPWLNGGFYDKSTFQFDFSSVNWCISNLAAQGADGELLGLPNGLTIRTATGAEPFIIMLESAGTRTPDYTFFRGDGTIASKFVGLPDPCFFAVVNGIGDFLSPVYRYSQGSSEFLVERDALGNWPVSKLFPAQIFVNGHFTTPQRTTPDSGQTPSHSGSTSYIFGDASEGIISIAWSWDSTWGSNAVAATVSGSWQDYEFDDGTWDGGKLIGNLPSGLVISVDPPPASARYGPPNILWDGVQLDFDPNQSSVYGSNPTGADVYHDSLGLGLTVTIGSGGAVNVTLTRADGSQLTGSYDSGSYHFAISGAPASSVLALDAQGFLMGLDAPTAPTVTLSGTSDFPTAPATITLTASPSDSYADYPITAVDFYRGSTKIGRATASPYVLVLPDQPAGNYSFTAVATVSYGASVTSDPVEVDVQTQGVVMAIHPLNSSILNAVPGIPRSVDVLCSPDYYPARIMFQSDSAGGTFSLEAGPGAAQSLNVVALISTPDDRLIDTIAYFTAPEISGSYTVQASAVGTSSSVSFSITTNPLVGSWRFSDIKSLGGGGGGTTTFAARLSQVARLDEASAPSSFVQDLSNTGNRAILHGEFETTVSFDGQSAALFDGANSYYEVSMDGPPVHGLGPVTPSLVFGTGPVTLAAWIQLPPPAQLASEGDVYEVLHTGQPDGPSLEFAMSGGTNNGLYCCLSDGTSKQTVICTADQSPLLADGNWHYVAFVRDQSGTGTLYIDGNVVGTQSGMGFSFDSTAEWQMGGGAVFSGAPWAMDAIQMRRDALDQNGVRALFNVDSDGNGIADWWEAKYFGYTGKDPKIIADIDGNTLLQRYQAGADPTDYYHGETPSITIKGGDGQFGAPSTPLPLPLVVEVRNQANALAVNAPVTFSLASGDAQLSASSVTTDSGGRAYVNLTTSSVAGGASSVTASAGPAANPASVVFHVGNIQPPSAPTNVNVVHNPDGSMDLTWSNPANDADGFNIQVRNQDGEWQNIGVVPAGTTSVHINPDHTIAQ